RERHARGASARGSAAPDARRAAHGTAADFEAWGTRQTRTLLRPLEEAGIDGLAEDVTLHRGKHRRAGVLFVGAMRHVDRRVERVNLERVVVLRTHGPRTRPAVDLP